MPRAADEPVRLTRIYTRGGDAGETSLGDGSRVSKLDCADRRVRHDRRAQLACSVSSSPATARRSCEEPLRRIQNEFFDVGADLCVPFAVEGRLRVEQGMVDRLEALCDASTSRCRS